MKREASRHQRALQAKQERRDNLQADKREQSLSLPSQQQRPPSHLQPTPRESKASTTKNATSSEYEPRAAAATGSTGGGDKYLKIRSWREIYGTGEGKELARKPQQKENTAAPAGPGGVLSVLGGKKKSSRKSMTAKPATPSPEESPDRALASTAHACLSPPLAAPTGRATDGPSTAARTESDASNQRQHSSLDFVAYPPPPPPPPPPPVGVCSGAFMQEVDGGDEIFSEFDGASFEPELHGPADRAAEFLDCGLSYYHDPATSLAVPPPPPPPPLPPLDDGNSEAENEPALSEVPADSHSGGEEDASLSPPPPPPLPLPLAPAYEAAVYLEISERQHSRVRLLREIQLGASLRRVQVRWDGRVHSYRLRTSANCRRMACAGVCTVAPRRRMRVGRYARESRARTSRASRAAICCSDTAGADQDGASVQ